MHQEFLMGNAAIASGAAAAGLNVVCGYPGTPSTEVLETAAKINDGSLYVEWSVNEKAALELGAGAAALCLVERSILGSRVLFLSFGCLVPVRLVSIVSSDCRIRRIPRSKKSPLCLPRRKNAENPRKPLRK